MAENIAIDGPVASGKTAVGRLIAKRLGWRFLDTGAMYRAVTWVALQLGTKLDDEEALTQLSSELDIRPVASEAGDKLLVDGEDITAYLNRRDVEQNVSLVAAASGVRSVLVERQRDIAQEGPIVMVGRDIGTVVLKDAGIKVYLKASVEARAQRRYLELQQKSSTASYRQVEDDLRRRDTLDSGRVDSPLRPADDALQIDTDNLGIEEVAENILSHVKTS